MKAAFLLLVILCGSARAGEFPQPAKPDECQTCTAPGKYTCARHLQVRVMRDPVTGKEIKQSKWEETCGNKQK